MHACIYVHCMCAGECMCTACVQVSVCALKPEAEAGILDFSLRCSLTYAASPEPGAHPPG